MKNLTRSCDVCQKSYAKSSNLSRHDKTAAHIESMKSKNTNIPITQSSFVDCGESIVEFGYDSVLIWVQLCTTSVQVVSQKPLTVLYCNCVSPKWLYTMSS